MLRRRDDAEGTPAEPGGVGPGRVGQADRRALGLLVLLAVVVVVPFSIAGHPLLQGDNLTQNFPLRVLTGADLRSGRLPLWNPLIWSGTPLLAGWNAGSMFPGTWLFAFLPAILAWTLNQLIAPVAASVGAYLFLRRLSCGPLAATAGAAALTWTGFLGGQTNHIGLVQGAAFLPWLLLAIDQLAARQASGAGPRQLLPGIFGVGAAVALTILAGDPRAVSSSAIVAGLYLLALMARARRRAGDLLVTTLIGGILGVLCSAIQWLPGLGFLHSSQRGQAAYSFFAGGSLSPVHLLMYLALPFADGGNGNFSMPTYKGTYNLAEIQIGVGVLAWVAFCAFLPEIGRSARSWWRRLPAGQHPAGQHPAGQHPAGAPTPPGGRQLGVWYVTAVLGALTTLGSATPFGHVFFAIPLFGSERLQNRNAEILDVALVVLLALFLEDVVGPSSRGRHERGEWLLSRPVSRTLALVPVALITGFGIFVVADPADAQRAYANPRLVADLAARLWPYLVWELAVLAGVTAAVLGAKRLGFSRLRQLLVASTALDITCFILMASFATAPASVLAGPTRESRAVQRLAGKQGRFALFNPSYANPSPDPQALNKIGVTDVNILQRDPSVQGYGSIVDQTYAAATSTHLYENLDVARLGGETFNTLNLSALVTTTSYLYQTLPPGVPVPIPGRPVPTGDPAPAPGSTGPWRLGRGAARVWQLGNPVRLRQVEVVLAPAARSTATRAARPPGRLRVGVIGTSGASIPHLVPVRDGRATLTLPAPRRAVAVSVQAPGGSRPLVAAVEVDTASGVLPGSRLVLNGQLQGDLQPPHWRWRSALGPFVVYANSETRGLAWLQPPRQHTPDTSARAPGTVVTTLSSALVPSTMVVRLPKPALLVRSETYEPGWTARLVPAGGGRSRVLAVHRFGLVQVVDLPAGNWRITWRYASGGMIAGMALTALGAATCLALLALVLVGRRKSGRGRGRGSGVRGSGAHRVEATVAGGPVQVPTS